MPTAEELRKLADLVEDQENTEREYEAARSSFEANPEDGQAKEDFHYFAEQLREARRKARAGNVPLPVPEGSATVTPGAIQKQAPEAGGE